MSAANLLVGSSSGRVYIVRCDPAAQTVSIKSTITAGKSPLALIIDVENKCFYCLDSNPEEDEGRLLTLMPSSYGTIDEKTSIGTGAANPCHMMSLGSNIYICHADGYSTIKSPLPAKSTRRRRASELPPVAENTVAESLTELYEISKTMDTEETPDPSEALDNIRKYLQAETHLEITELKQFVPTQETVLKFIKTQDDRYIIGITRKGASSYSIRSDGTLLKQHAFPQEDLIDCATDDQCCFLLTRKQIVRVRLVADGQLETLSNYPCDYQGLKSITISAKHGIALISTANSVLSMNLRSGNITKMNIHADYLCLSKDEQLFFTNNIALNTVTMFSIRGENLGSCSVRDPAQIVHMS